MSSDDIFTPRIGDSPAANTFLALCFVLKLSTSILKSSYTLFISELYISRYSSSRWIRSVMAVCVCRFLSIALCRRTVLTRFFFIFLSFSSSDKLSNSANALLLCWYSPNSLVRMNCFLVHASQIVIPSAQRSALASNLSSLSLLYSSGHTYLKTSFENKQKTFFGNRDLRFLEKINFKILVFLQFQLMK